MNSNIIPINRPRNEADVFFEICNSPAQRIRRMERRKAQQRKTKRNTAGVYSGLITAGTVLGLILGTVI